MTRLFERMVVIGEEHQGALPIPCNVEGCETILYFRTHAKKTPRVSAKDNLNSHFRRIHSGLGDRQRSNLLREAVKGL